MCFQMDLLPQRLLHVVSFILHCVVVSSIASYQSLPLSLSSIFLDSLELNVGNDHYLLLLVSYGCTCPWMCACVYMCMYVLCTRITCNCYPCVLAVCVNSACTCMCCDYTFNIRRKERERGGGGGWRSGGERERRVKEWERERERDRDRPLVRSVLKFQLLLYTLAIQYNIRNHVQYMCSTCAVHVHMSLMLMLVCACSYSGDT